MRWMISILLLIACSLLFAAGKGRQVSLDRKELVSDSLNNDLTLASFVSAGYSLNISSYTLKELDLVLQENKNTMFLLGQSQEGRKINAFYIPGTSDLRAIVIAGVHGSELSAVEVAYRLASQLLQGKQPYYSVIIVPSLFPDNAARAMDKPEQIGSPDNIGRYTYPYAVDPNRQMPSPGKSYNETRGLDHHGRKIEQENRFLLELIQAFKPQRIANLHAIRDMNYGGVYADPRTDHNSIALGYSSDSSLAVDMALYIHQQGANVAGNNPDKKPTALYYRDPWPAPAGNLQKRNMSATSLKAKRGSGVSLGIWGSTAIANEEDISKNRDAIRILTIEYPGYKRPADYKAEAEQLFQHKQSASFATAIQTIFLEQYYTENENNDMVKK
ncbi:MAG TPA: M14 family zinc carboxypeptidase [Chitinophagaceae bacterium]